MPRGRQTELKKGTEGKIRGIKSSKPTRIRDSDAARYEVLPKIRSVQEGRIRLGSVAPLLSHRAKALAMENHYNHYSDDEEPDVSDDSDQDSFTEDDYDEELHDYDRHHRSYDRHRAPFHVKRDYEDYDDELVPSSSFPVSTSQFLRPRPQPKQYKTHKSAATTSIAAVTKLVSNAKPKKSTARGNPKDRNKKTKAVPKTSRSGPITRSRGAALMNKNDY